MNIKDIPSEQRVVGTRFLYRNTGDEISAYHSNIKETKIVEISPSGELINLEGYGWAAWNTTVIDVLEILERRTP